MASRAERPGGPPTYPWYATLSERERQVAWCVAAGSSNRDIAHALAISEKTVEKHLTRVFAKIGVRSRAQLAIFIVTRPPWGAS
jgi:DNA-binding NarL/FixJ family response regulator